MLVNDRWLLQWPHATCFNATPRTSDHSPLILQGYEPRSLKRLFHFDNYLAKSTGFLAMVSEVWQHPIYVTPMYSITRKSLKKKLRLLRKDKGDLSANVTQAKDFLSSIQLLLVLDPLNDLLLLMERVARLVLLKATNLERLMLQQRAKIAGLKEGDQCTKIFFRKIATRRASQKIFQITSSSGVCIKEASGVATEFVQFYTNLLGGGEGIASSILCFSDLGYDTLYRRKWGLT
ncbi:UNVERIFIED_CONTAM: hypothetical protein Slati_0875500 [Sesamum latifolium]|uniref:Uncharacterized protein n=1 Tax=Sesamum latifolium TaxID=2727402 RepID=A0AAW2XP47_9LAMI